MQLGSGVAVAVAEQRYRRLRADWAQRPKVRLWGGGVALAALLGGISYLDGYTTLFTARDTDDVCQAMGCTGYCHFDPISRTLYTVRVLHLARRELRDAVRCCQRSSASTAWPASVFPTSPPSSASSPPTCPTASAG